MSIPFLVCVFLAASPAIAGDLEITGSVLPISATVRRRHSEESADAETTL